MQGWLPGVGSLWGWRGVEGGRQAATPCHPFPSHAPPAKPLLCTPPPQINLFLRILRRRPDGFHDLASLFQVVSWGDDMAFTPLGCDSGADELACDAPGVPTDASNLAIKVLGCWGTGGGGVAAVDC